MYQPAPACMDSKEAKKPKYSPFFNHNNIISKTHFNSQGAGTEKWEFRSTIATENV